MSRAARTARCSSNVFFKRATRALSKTRKRLAGSAAAQSCSRKTRVGLSPERFQIHVNIREFTCRNAQKAKRATRLEMHAHDVLPRVNEQRPRVRPGKEC